MRLTSYAIDGPRALPAESELQKQTAVLQAELVAKSDELASLKAQLHVLLTDMDASMASMCDTAKHFARKREVCFASERLENTKVRATADGIRDRARALSGATPPEATRMPHPRNKDAAED